MRKLIARNDSKICLLANRCMWLGYLQEYPDYWTQGETEEELKENLLDIYQELTDGIIPNVRKVAELEVL